MQRTLLTVSFCRWHHIAQKLCIMSTDRSSRALSSLIKKPNAPKVILDKEELKKRLNPIQYHVTQEKGTERPFSGEYLRLKDNGMYACVVCEQELFSSDEKFDSGCGWPAFSSIQDQSKVILTADYSHNQVRTEVTCSNCGAHLGHVFDDGPKPTGIRYCINSASLRFHKKAATDANNNSSNQVLE